MRVRVTLTLRPEAWSTSVSAETIKRAAEIGADSIKAYVEARWPGSETTIEFVDRQDDIVEVPGVDKETLLDVSSGILNLINDRFEDWISEAFGRPAEQQ